MHTQIRNRCLLYIYVFRGSLVLTSSLLSLCDVTSAFIIGIPSKNHVILAAHVLYIVRIDMQKNNQRAKRKQKQKCINTHKIRNSSILKEVKFKGYFKSKYNAIAIAMHTNTMLK